MTARLHIVIVNYKTAELVVDCLRSIQANGLQLDDLRVHVVDNDSRDGSVLLLQEKIDSSSWSRWVKVHAADRNGGFAYGNNIGIRAALESAGIQYVLLLNPDTVVRPGALNALMTFMDGHSRAGIAGSALENVDGDRDCSAHNTPSPLGELEGSARLRFLSRLLRRYAVSLDTGDTQQQCEWVSGASLLIRRRVIEDIGMLDDRFFLYFEEVDYCLRARKAGWEVWYVPGSRVVHLEGSSTGIQKTHQRRPPYWFASRRRFFVKHYGIRGMVAADALWAIGHASLRMRRVLGLGNGGPTRDPPGMAADLLLGDLRALMQGDLRSLRSESSSHG